MLTFQFEQPGLKDISQKGSKQQAPQHKDQYVMQC